MNKVRIIGLGILIIGAIAQLFIENETIDFFSAVLIGAGIGLLLTGRIKK
tara:strand:+ start:491 stop:640 length:150 start_codon:yes stop_codon:yes gene_type:complete